MKSLSTINVIQIFLKTYKKNILAKCFSDIKLNEYIHNKKHNKFFVNNTLNTQTYQSIIIPTKKLIKKYVLLRATHEFKYSWEKYKEIVNRAVHLINIQTTNNNTYMNIKKKIIILKKNKIVSLFLNMQYHILQNVELLSRINIKHAKCKLQNKLEINMNTYFYLDNKIFTNTKE